MQKKQLIIILLTVFLLGDLVFSFIQYYNTPLYGDITVSAWPNENVQRLLDDPFGIQVLKTGEKQFNPNRYFSHLFLKEYFRSVPFFFQKFASPVSSVYLASALAKIMVQIIFIFFLAQFISNDKLFNRKFLISALIITPLFQIFGYWSRMGIVDKSVAYTFFYAMPLVMLMLYFLPVFKQIQGKSKFRKINYIYLAPLIIILPFTGPLNPPVIILVSLFIFLDFWFHSEEKEIITVIKIIPISIYILLVPICILSLYSLFLGFYDSSFALEAIPIAERFKKLPEGLFSQLFHSPGFPLMLLIIGINMYIIKRNNYPGKDKLNKILIWIGVFSLVYISLLPIGGYRPYRPKIIRYDTLIPVNIALYYLFGATTYLIINQIKEKKKKIYLFVIIVYLIFLTIVDFDGIGENRGERSAFGKMATSTSEIVTIPKDCPVLDWHDVYDYNLTKDKAELIHYWQITDETKLFYNEP